MDSISTQNLSSLQTNRLLVGQYSDPKVGSVRADMFAQIKPAVLSTIIPDNAIYDSLVLQLRYDFYNYGTRGETDLALTVHEITEELNNENIFYSNTPVVYDPTPLGSATSRINAAFFDQEATDTDVDSVVTVKIKLDDTFGIRLFNAIDPEDENYTNFNLFKSIFKGLAVVPQQADKIVGVSNNNANTSLTLYYHVDNTKYTSLFVLSQGVNFTQIATNRTGTELEGLTQYFTSFEPGQNRYIQSGTALVTKLDFSKYYEYIDTIPNLLLNSAELMIEGVPADANYAVNKKLALAMLTDNNRFKTTRTYQDTLDYIEFGGLAVIGIVANSDLTRSLFAADDQGSLLELQHSETNSSYTSYPTRFFQKLIELRDKPYPYWALVSSNPALGKSVNRTVFLQDNLKLKIYYTRPTPNSNE